MSCESHGCSQPAQPQHCCPSSYCHDGLLNLPQRARLHLTGVEQGSKCMSRFGMQEKGIVLYDGNGGAIVTEQPVLQMPFLRNLIVDGSGKPIPGTDGQYQEENPPGAPNLIISDDCGRQYRWHGRKGYRQVVLWDGCNFVMGPDRDQAELADFPSINNGSECNFYEAVLVDVGGGTYALGYRLNRSNTPGQIQMFAGPTSSKPDDWLVCDGTAYSPFMYPELFSRIGYSWGKVGEDFRVPDMRGRFPRGVDAGGGADPDANERFSLYSDGNTGNQVGTYQDDAFQCHTFARNTFPTDTITPDLTGTDEVTVQDFTAPIDGNTGGAITSSCGEPRTSDETRPKNAAVLFLIYAGCKQEV